MNRLIIALALLLTTPTQAYDDAPYAENCTYQGTERAGDTYAQGVFECWPDGRARTMEAALSDYMPRQVIEAALAEGCRAAGCEHKHRGMK